MSNDFALVAFFDYTLESFETKKPADIFQQSEFCASERISHSGQGDNVNNFSSTEF